MQLHLLSGKHLIKHHGRRSSQQFFYMVRDFRENLKWLTYRQTNLLFWCLCVGAELLYPKNVKGNIKKQIMKSRRKLRQCVFCFLPFWSSSIWIVFHFGRCPELWQFCVEKQAFGLQRSTRKRCNRPG